MTIPGRFVTLLWRQRTGGPGKKVLISPKWIQSVSWDAREFVIGLSRETIKAAPEYTDESLLTRDYETGLYGHYDREGYWVEELSVV
jgi:predicted glycosyl hydrolase (DUF1957 family)